jgi:hypothetical protein
MGVAAPCASALGSQFVPVTVIVREHGRVVATTVVSYRSNRDRYRLSLRPGQYTISAPQSADEPERVVLESGERLTVNLLNRCI